MSDIFKLIYLDQTNNKNMTVFLGDDGDVDINEMFIKDKENVLFQGLFSKDQLDTIVKDNIKVTFSKQKIYIDDTIETIKKKIIIAFNEENNVKHSNERLSDEIFVTRKITKGIGNILKGTQDILTLGNLNAKRDWGHAKDYVYGMYLMLKHETPDDYVLSMGEQYTVREFLEIAFSSVDINITWKNSGVDEVGVDDNGRVMVKVDEKYFRPSEVETLLGDSTKAKTVLGWEHKYTFKELVESMVKHDLQ